jgi:hypothetical protein
VDTKTTDTLGAHAADWSRRDGDCLREYSGNGVDGTVEVVSEGHWKLFTRSAVATESGY